MFAIGPSLREARTRRGLSSADVQKAIRIRERYLTALEEERWELLPGDAYVKGFLRTYAEYLGLDGHLYVDEYNGRHVRSREPAFMPEPLAPSVSRIGILRPLAAIAAIVAVVAAVAAWQLRGSGGSSPSSAGSRDGAAAARTTGTHATRPAGHAKAKKKASSKPVAAKPARAVLAATNGSVWLQARSGSATGAVLYEGTLEPGQTVPVSLAQTVWLRVGAPWNLEVRVAGKALAGLPATTGDVLLTSAGLQPAG